jgi:hypothetical protein
MATQTDPPTQPNKPNKSKSNSHGRFAKDTQREIVAKTVTKIVRPTAEPLSDAQRRELIAVTAYHLAESRNFQPGHEEEDWLSAEAQIGSMGALAS